MIKNTTNFNWSNVGVYTGITYAIWCVLAVITMFVRDLAHTPWVEAGVPGVGFALACGVGWEYFRLDKARKSSH